MTERRRSRELHQRAHDVFERANEMFQDNMYEKAHQLFKECIYAISEAEAIDLLPKVLGKVAVCCEKLGDVRQAQIFKNFEKQYYETVLVRHSLDMIDEEKENLQQIQRRAAELEGLARLCDENDCAKLALDYITKASLIRRSKFGHNADTRKTLGKFEDYYAKAGESEYKSSLESFRRSSSISLHRTSRHSSMDSVDEPAARRRTSILKKQPSSFDNSTKKKVHFPESLPRYTDEKRRRAFNKMTLIGVWVAMVHFLLPPILPQTLTHLAVQLKVIAVLIGLIIITR